MKSKPGTLGKVKQAHNFIGKIRSLSVLNTLMLKVRILLFMYFIHSNITLI